MEHKAEQILKAIESLLSSLSTTGESVKRARAHNWSGEELPAISIFMGEDSPLDTDRYNISFIDCGLVVNVESIASNLSYANVENTLNQIRAEVITKMKESLNLGLDFVIEVKETGALSPEISGETNRTTAQQIFSFLIKYRRNVNDPRL